MNCLDTIQSIPVESFTILYSFLSKLFVTEHLQKGPDRNWQKEEVEGEDEKNNMKRKEMAF